MNRNKKQAIKRQKREAARAKSSARRGFEQQPVFFETPRGRYQMPNSLWQRIKDVPAARESIIAAAGTHGERGFKSQVVALQHQAARTRFAASDVHLNPDDSPDLPFPKIRVCDGATWEKIRQVPKAEEALVAAAKRGGEEAVAEVVAELVAEHKAVAEAIEQGANDLLRLGFILPAEHGSVVALAANNQAFALSGLAKLTARAAHSARQTSPTLPPELAKLLRELDVPRVQAEATE